MHDNKQLNLRRICRLIQAGKLIIGSSEPVSVQSMTNIATSDVDGCVKQINELANAGCEIVRVAVPGAKDTAALPDIIKQINIPIVADVHFHFARALEAIEAGVNKIRLNPGNIKDRQQVKTVVDACKANQVAIRVGVNEGSIVDLKDNGRHQHEKDMPMAQLMLDKMTDYVRIFEDNDFSNLVLSAKCHDAARTIEVNRLIAHNFDYPIHLGVTHAGTVQTGSIRSAVALGTLLAEGIGDTIRVSLAGDPVTEVGVAWEILTSLKLRQQRGIELIACPTCGRTEIDLLAMVNQVSEAIKEIKYPMTVAVMGCVVNGPGEADNADVALCGGKDKVVIYRSGKKTATIPATQAVAALLQQINLFIKENNG
ncbi:MAG: flavodoxin-dependent (E)-4-hydroxy-3-methylbut-2-enyl-diphosphate synthase [Phycisphaerae bacterium]|nr:flavodoxin-dependent (E)-4-hydroxy-3-methylbut-2-enyl-diphosphate synthase [Phycisphaerae bacterium]